jgi:hypothetical protein
LRRKLLILNLALAMALVYAGVRIRGEWLAAKARERATLRAKVASLAPPQLAPLPQTPPVLPSSYLNIADKMLFDKSRDSKVVVEPPQPPPVKPVPPMPAYHGQMDIGGGPIVFLTTPGDAGRQSARIGDRVGPFTLVDANTAELTFEWEGQTIRKSTEELLDHSIPAPGPAIARPEAAAAPAPTMPVMPKTPTGPGADVGDGTGRKHCDPNDSSPEGAVVDGMRKTSRVTPFGSQCWWEPAR